MSETILPCPKCKDQRVHTVTKGPDTNNIVRRLYTCTKCNYSSMRGKRGEVIHVEGGRIIFEQNPKTIEKKPCPHCKTIDMREGSPIGISITGLCTNCRDELWKKIEPIIKEYTEMRQ